MATLGSASLISYALPSGGRSLACACTLASAALVSGTARADDWYVQTSLLTRHFSEAPHHNNRSALVNVERLWGPRWAVGGAYFRNTFSQNCFYGYVGRRWVRTLGPEQSVQLKLTGGFVYGYRDEYQHKIPFNDLGVAPAILPSVGYRHGRLATELIVFGLEGAMLTAGFYFR